MQQIEPRPTDGEMWQCAKHAILWTMVIAIGIVLVAYSLAKLTVV